MSEEATLELVSVIMAAYNAEDTLESAVRSVLEQTYPNVELLIVDDCSTDFTYTIAKRLQEQDARVYVYRNSENLGAARTREHGLRMANGNWIAILDADDIWKADKIARQMELQKETNAELLYTGSSFMEADGKPICWTLHVPETLSYRQLLKQNLISNSSALVRHDLYEQNYAACDTIHEDYAIWLRILRSGRMAYGIDEPLIFYRISQKSKSGNKIHSAVMNWNTYRFIGLNPLQAAYCEFWYMLKGALKYHNLKK